MPLQHEKKGQWVPSDNQYTQTEIIMAEKVTQNQPATGANKSIIALQKVVPTDINSPEECLEKMQNFSRSQTL